MTPQPYSFPPLGVLLVAVIAFLGGRWSDGVTIALPDVIPATVEEKPTAATYVYEKDDHAIPSPVAAALNTINRESGHVLATACEVNAKDGTGDVPDQYKVAVAAAVEAGLPCLVVTAGDKVLRVVKNPKDEQSVLEAVR